MGDVILYIVVIVALTTVWIEWLPRKYDILIGLPVAIMIIGIGIKYLPNLYGWPPFFDLLKSVARAVQTSLVKTASFFSPANKRAMRTPAHESKAAPALPKPGIPRRVWIGGIALTAFSPITAIPAAIVLAIVLTIVDLMPADTKSFVSSFTQIMKSVLGNAFLIQVATLDLVIRCFLITGPLLLFAGVGGAKWADRTGCYWQRLLGVALGGGAFVGIWELICYGSTRCEDFKGLVYMIFSLIAAFMISKEERSFVKRSSIGLKRRTGNQYPAAWPSLRDSVAP